MSATDSPESDGEVITIDKTYPIRRHKNAYRYRVTIPVKILDSAGVENKDKIGVSLTQEEGFVVIEYTTDVTNSDLVFTVSRHTTGEVSVPSAIGAALEMDTATVQWSRVKTDTGFVYRAKTDISLVDMEFSEEDVFKTESLTHVKQDINRDEGDWEQEYFRAYLNSEENKSFLNSGSDETVAIRIVRVGDHPAVMLDSQTEGVSEKSVKEIIWTNKNYHDEREEDMEITASKSNNPDQDAVVYIPNDIVRALGFVDKEFFWVSQNGKLIFYPVS